MTHILHRKTSHSYPFAASSQGVIFRDGAGKEYIDASSGADGGRRQLGRGSGGIGLFQARA
jgi:hypothetical protein